MATAVALRISPREYYRRERVAPFKSEFINGEIVAMAGGTSRHSLIKTNLVGELRNLLKGRPCAPYDSDQRVKVKDTGLRTYPDASVICGPLEYDPEDDQAETATNPTALFEVLSDSSEAYDRGAKAAHYRRVESLRAYVLISQNMPFVEMQHLVLGQGWQVAEATGLDAFLHIPCLGIDLSLAEIYDRVTWTGSGQSALPLRVLE